VRIVPQIEKKAAHRGLWRWARSDAFAEACTAKQAPAPAARRIHRMSTSLLLVGIFCPGNGCPGRRQYAVGRRDVDPAAEWARAGRDDSAGRVTGEGAA
jgi:hypothetical protein